MPYLDMNSSEMSWTDPDTVPRPVVTYGAADIDISSLDAASMDRLEMDFHAHRKAQLVLVLRGVLTCEVAGGMWMVPPQSAIWVPGNTLHRITAAGMLECYIAFIDLSVTANLSPDCCAVTANPLLRELLIRSAALPLLYDEAGKDAHLVTLLLDELADAPLGNLHLPMPTDPRLRKIVELIMSNPADRGTIRSWARRVGLSERTLARLLSQQTGMSFGRWRQQLHLMLAVKWLSAGASVQQVADDLGYESASSFVMMFRKALGCPPGRYMNERQSTSHGVC